MLNLKVVQDNPKLIADIHNDTPKIHANFSLHIPGPQGMHGGAYEHYQMTPASVWRIVHNLGYYPSITVVDSADNVVYGEASYIDINTVEIEFASSFSGKVYFS